MWKTIKFLSLLIKLNAPNTVISGYSKIMMNIFIEKSSNYRTFRFSSFNHIFENGVNGITKEAGGFANRVLPAGSRKWNSVSIFFKNPSRLVATTQVAYRADDKLVRPARWKSWNTYEYAEIYIYMYKRSCEWTEMRDRFRKRLSSSSSNASLFHRLSKILSS